MTDLLSCRTIPDFVSLQSSLVQGNVERMLENSQRLAQLTAQVAQEATRTLTDNPSTIGALAKDCLDALPACEPGAPHQGLGSTARLFVCNRMPP